MRTHEARNWFHTVARVASVCFLAGAVAAYCYERWFHPPAPGGFEPSGGFNLAMILLVILALSSAFLAVALPEKRGSEPLSPLWPYVVPVVATLFLTLMMPQVH